MAVLARLLRTLLLGVCLLLALAALPFLLLLIPAVREYALAHGLAYLRDQTGYSLSVGELERIDPWALHARELHLKDETGQELVALAGVDVSLRPSSLLRGGITLPSVRVWGLRVSLPEASSEQPEATEPPAKETQDGASSFEIRVERARVEDAELGLSWLDADYRVRIEQLEAGGSWGRSWNVGLRSLDANLQRAGRELVWLSSQAGEWDAERGGTMTLAGAIGRAPLFMNVKLAALSDEQLWPAGSLDLTVRGLDRRGLEPLGVPEGAGLVRGQDLTLQADSTGTQLEARLSLRSQAGQLELSARLDPQQLEATLQLPRLRLAEASDYLPDLRAQGSLHARWGYAGAPYPLEAEWRQVKLDGEALPNGRASGSLDLDAGWVHLDQLVLQGFERALELRGSYGFDAGDAELALRLREFSLERIPWLQSQGIQGSSDAQLAFRAKGEQDFTAQGFLELRKPRYAAVSARRVQLQLALVGELDAPRGEAELVVQQLKAQRMVLDRLALDFDGDTQHVHGKLLAFGPDSAFSADLLGSRPSAETYELKGSGNGRFAGRPVYFRLASFAENETGAYIGELWLRSERQRLHGRAQLDRKQRFDAILETQSLDLASWAQLAGVDGLKGHVEAFVHASGTAERPLVNVKLTAASVYGMNEGPFDVMLNLETDLEQGKLSSDMELTSPVDPDLRVNANVRAAFPASDLAALSSVLEETTYELTLRSRAPIARLAHHAGPRMEALRGTLSANLDAHGNLDDPHAELSVNATLGMPADTDDPPEVLNVKAKVTPELGQLQIALSDVEGALLSIQGEAEWPAGSLRKAVQQTTSLTTLPKFHLRAFLAERRLDMMQGAVAYLAGVYKLAMPIRAKAELDLQGEADRLEGTARAKLLVFGDKLDADCALGTQSKIDLDAELKQNELRLKFLGYAQDGGSLKGDVRTTLARDSTRPDGTSPLGTTRIEAEGNRIALSKMPGLCDLSGGRADFTLRGEAFGERPPQAALELQVVDLQTVRSEPLGIKLKAGLDAKSAHVHSELSSRGKTTGTLAAKVALRYADSMLPSIAADAPLEAQLSVRDLPLAPFMSIGEQLGRPGGHATADLKVTGTLDRPRPKGFVEVHDASLSIAALAQPFRGVHARVELDQHRLTLRELTAKDLGGTLRVSGEARYADDFSGLANLRIEAKKFPLRRQGVVVGELTTNTLVSAALNQTLQADVDVKVRDGRIWLTGEQGGEVQSLDANSAVRFIDAPEETAQEAGQPSEPGLSLRKLKLASEREIWLMHKDFSVQVGFDIRISQEDGPKIEGEARLVRGDFMLLGKSFDIQKGAIRFTGDSPPDPELDLRASYRSNTGEDLIVQITGRGSSPALTFSGAATNAGDAVLVLSGRGKAGAENQARADAAGFAASVTAGLLSVTARRELGDWVPMLRVETDAQGTPSRAAAGFDASKLIPPFLDGIAKGAYVEGIVGSTQTNNPRGGSVGLGVRLELAFPRDLITTFGYGPGPNWSTDLAWAP
jgi:autotransporter translocation and assembly factor TamB